MTDYKRLAEQILEAVGGKANVTFVAHCITRLRFNLKDESKAADAQVEAIDGVVGVQHAAGQYQVIIGPGVDQAYDEVLALTGQVESVTVDAGTEEKPHGIAAVMKVISGVMMPVLPPLTACGIISALAVVLKTTGILGAEDGLYILINTIGNACLYFFPIIVAGSAAKFFGMDTWLGCVLGAVMIHPNLTAIAGAGGTIDILGMQFSIIDYTSSVFPAIVAAAFASVLYNFFRKHLPKVVTFVLTPTLTLIISAPLPLFIIGPIVHMLSQLLADASLAIYNLSPILCGVIFGPIFALVFIPLGLHWAFIVLCINNISTLGKDPILGLMCGSMTFVGVLLAYALRCTDPDERSMALGTTFTAFFGISEPGLYGVVLQHRETIIASAVAGAIGAIFPAVFGTCQFTMGSSGIFSFPTYVDPSGNPNSLIGAILGNVVGMALAFVITWILYRNKAGKQQTRA